MKENKSTVLLILGCQRSGTTLLASMLGGHSEINMLFESTSKDVLRLTGKKFSGNKVLAWRQIRNRARASKWGHLINRIANLDLFPIRKHHKIRPFPTSVLSIQDYIDKGAVIITMVRHKEEVINSITSRTKMSRHQAEREYNRAMKEMALVKDKAINVDFSDLVHAPVKTLSAISERLGLEFEPRMLEGTAYNRVYPHATVLKEKSLHPAIL